jgi:hypothetical protein
MTLQDWRLLRTERGRDRVFSTPVALATIEMVGDAAPQERAIIRAPTALEVVQGDRDRVLSS